MDWQTIFSGLAFIISCVALWFSFAKYNKELYMKRKQEVFIEFYSALKEFYDNLRFFNDLYSGDYSYDYVGIKVLFKEISNFEDKFKFLYFAYKNFFPYFNNINKVDSAKLEGFILERDLETYLLKIKGICYLEDETLYYRINELMSELLDFAGRISSLIDESKAIEYLEKEIII